MAYGGLPAALRCSAEERARLVDVASGRQKADMAVLDADVINVYTGELVKDCPIAIAGRWIACVGSGALDSIGAKTRIIHGKGKIVAPGYIEAHTHLAWLYSAASFLPYAIKGGTTTVVTETMEAFPIGGVAGVIDFLESMKDQPIKVFGTAPAMVSISRQAHGISLEDLQVLLERDDIVGLGESYWQALLQAPDSLLGAYGKTLETGKLVEGHSAGARGGKLAAYAAAGVSSCHEPIRAPEVIERLRMGMYVMIREGSIRRDLEAISAINREGIDMRRVILATDGVEPEDLMKRGYLEYVVQKAVDCGFEPITAVQMATLNVAEHFKLDAAVGGIAPGKMADLLILPDIGTMTPETVIGAGAVIADNGQVLAAPRSHQFSRTSSESILLPRLMKPRDFVVSAENRQKEAGVRIIEMKTDLVTAERHETLPIVGNEIRIDLDRDILKVAAVDRKGLPGKIFVGLIVGFQMNRGAMAASGAWDTADIVAVGTNESDMAEAVNRIQALQGGIVVIDGGRVSAELALPVMGILSTAPMADIARDLKAVRDAAKELGVPFPDPTLSLVTLTGAAIPYLRICEEGLVNLKDGRSVGIFLD